MIKNEEKEAEDVLHLSRWVDDSKVSTELT